MSREIDDILIGVNKGSVRDRVDSSDVACVMLHLFGLHRSDAFYLTKCSGTITDSVLDKQAKAFFDVGRVKELTDAVRPFVDARKEKLPQGEGYDISWADVDIESLTVEELEKMGTHLLRAASVSAESTPKDINDLIKMLDSIGALPKKKAEDKDFKQVIIQPLFNSICPNCNHEVYIHAEVAAVVPEPVMEKPKRKKKEKNVDGLEIVDI